MLNRDLSTKLDIISKYARLEETECGEYWIMLLETAQMLRSDGISKSFKAAIIAEIDLVCKDLLENWKIIEEKAIVETRSCPGNKILSKREIVDTRVVHRSEPEFHKKQIDPLELGLP